MALPPISKFWGAGSVPEDSAAAQWSLLWVGDLAAGEDVEAAAAEASMSTSHTDPFSTTTADQSWMRRLIRSTVYLYRKPAITRAGSESAWEGRSTSRIFIKAETRHSCLGTTREAAAALATISFPMCQRWQNVPEIFRLY